MFGNRVLAAGIVVLVSNLFHEYIVNVSGGIFMPTITVQFLLMSFPVSLMKIKDSKFGNIGLLAGMVTFKGFDVFFWSCEYYARRNCYDDGDGYFKFKMFDCK